MKTLITVLALTVFLSFVPMANVSFAAEKFQAFGEGKKELKYYWICQCFKKEKSAKIDLSFDLFNIDSFYAANKEALKKCKEFLKVRVVTATCVQFEKTGPRWNQDGATKTKKNQSEDDIFRLEK